MTKKKESWVKEMERKRQEIKDYEANPNRKYEDKPCLTCSVLEQCLEKRKENQNPNFRFCD